MIDSRRLHLMWLDERRQGELVRAALADHPDEKTVSLLAISVSHLEKHWKLQLELPLGLEDETRRPAPKSAKVVLV